MEVAEIIVEARNELRNDVPDWHYCCIFAGIGPAEGRTRWLFEFEMPNDLLMDTFWEVMNKEYGYHPDGFEIGDVLVLSDVGRERFLCRIQELTDTSCDLAMPPSQADTRSLRASVLPASPSDPSSSTVDLSSTRDQAAQPVAGPSRISSLISNNHQRDRPTRAIGNNVDEDFDNSDAFMRIRRKTGPSESHKASTQPISTGREVIVLSDEEDPPEILSVAQHRGFSHGQQQRNEKHSPRSQVSTPGHLQSTPRLKSTRQEQDILDICTPSPPPISPPLPRTSPPLSAGRSAGPTHHSGRGDKSHSQMPNYHSGVKSSTSQNPFEIYKLKSPAAPAPASMTPRPTRMRKRKRSQGEEEGRARDIALQQPSFDWGNPTSFCFSTPNAPAPAKSAVNHASVKQAAANLPTRFDQAAQPGEDVFSTPPRRGVGTTKQRSNDQSRLKSAAKASFSEVIDLTDDADPFFDVSVPTNPLDTRRSSPPGAFSSRARTPLQFNGLLSSPPAPSGSSEQVANSIPLFTPSISDGDDQQVEPLSPLRPNGLLSPSPVASWNPQVDHVDDIGMGVQAERSAKPVPRPPSSDSDVDEDNAFIRNRPAKRNPRRELVVSQNYAHDQTREDTGDLSKICHADSRHQTDEQANSSLTENHFLKLMEWYNRQNMSSHHIERQSTTPRVQFRISFRSNDISVTLASTTRSLRSELRGFENPKRLSDASPTAWPPVIDLDAATKHQISNTVTEAAILINVEQQVRSVSLIARVLPDESSVAPPTTAQISLFKVMIARMSRQREFFLCNEPTRQDSTVHKQLIVFASGPGHAVLAHALGVPHELINMPCALLVAAITSANFA